jgi:Fungal specific transcription factor domain.
MARVWPGLKDGIQIFPHDEYTDILLPPTHVQDRLIKLYFTYIHPVFPVIHKASFMREYNTRYVISLFPTVLYRVSISL